MPLHIQKLGAVLGRRQHARLMFSKNSVTITSNQTIHRISDHPGQNASDTRQSPNSPERFYDMEDRIRTHQHSFTGFAMIDDDIKRIEVARIRPVALEQCRREFALQ